MLKIRLKRTGKRNQPSYRIIVIKARTKRDGRAVEYLGYLDPISKKLEVNVERAKYWLSVGAQPTDTVRSILAKHKLIEKKQRPKRPPLKPKKEILKGEEKQKEPQTKEKKVKKDIEEKKEEKPKPEEKSKPKEEKEKKVETEDKKDKSK
ncbi:30S ribosomal protein S16 [Candidatus Dojkabacteria bacterium]|nr:30S ribosomal protein S16 [Candidatus Dojkabacteria bacterium]